MLSIDFCHYLLLDDGDQFPIFVGMSLGEITEAGCLSCQGRQRRVQPVLFLTTFAVTQVKRSVRHTHYGIGGVKIDRTISAAPRNTGVCRKTAS
jgi:hypothetical protein